MSEDRIIVRFALPAEERLKLRKHIETLFQKGEAFSVLSLRVVYRLADMAQEQAYAPVRVGFSIPKKRIKRANGRNRIRRLLKEAWRINKHGLYHNIPPGKQLHCFLIYTGQHSAHDFSLETATESVSKCFEKLSGSISS